MGTQKPLPAHTVPELTAACGDAPHAPACSHRELVKFQLILYQRNSICLMQMQCPATACLKQSSNRASQYYLPSLLFIH